MWDKLFVEVFMRLWKRKLISGSSLRKGVTNSCGCLHFEVTALLEGEASFNFYLEYIKETPKEETYHLK